MTNTRKQRRGKNLLTAKEVKAAKATTKELVLNDGGGLVLRIRPSGKRTWRLRYSVEGARRVMDLGDGVLLGLQEARTKADELRKLVDEGVDPAAHRRQQAEARRREQAARRTFSAALERWAELVLSGRKDSGKESMRALHKDVVPVIGERDLQDVGRGDLVDILEGIKKRGAGRMANRTLADLKQFLAWCEMREWVERNPLSGVSKDRIGGRDAERERVLSAVELRKLQAAIPKAHLDKRTEHALWILLGTAARVGELIQARWEHVDFKAGTWHLPETKNSKPHLIHLSDFTTRHFKALQELTNWSGWVLPSTQKEDTHVCLKSITKQVRDRQREKALTHRCERGLQALVLSGGSWTPHDLRRTAATMMIDIGVLPDVVERCLNHTEQNRIKRTYQRHDYLVERRDAMQRLGNRLDEILKGETRKVIPLRESGV
jgi:integrase